MLPAPVEEEVNKHKLQDVVVKHDAYFSNRDVASLAKTACLGATLPVTVLSNYILKYLAIHSGTTARVLQ